jgi:hypothetical protein
VTSSLQGGGPGNETELNLQSWPFTKKCGSGATSGMVGSPQPMEMSSNTLWPWDVKLYYQFLHLHSPHTLVRMNFVGLVCERYNKT